MESCSGMMAGMSHKLSLCTQPGIQNEESQSPGNFCEPSAWPAALHVVSMHHPDDCVSQKGGSIGFTHSGFATDVWDEPDPASHCHGSSSLSSDKRTGQVSGNHTKVSDAHANINIICMRLHADARLLDNHIRTWRAAPVNASPLI